MVPGTRPLVGVVTHELRAEPQPAWAPAPGRRERDLAPQRLSMRLTYMQAVQEAGGIAVVIPAHGFADDAAALLDRLGIAKAHFVGLSMGAMIGMAFALRHPGRLGRLVLANTTLSYGPEGRSMWAARAKAVQQGGLEAIKDMVMNRYFSDVYRSGQAASVAQVTERFLQTPVDGYLGCCDAIGELDFTDDVSRIHARTLVIAGEADAGTPPAMAEAIARRISGSQLAVIPGAAHLAAVEKPEEFAALVKGFLEAP